MIPPSFTHSASGTPRVEMRVSAVTGTVSARTEDPRSGPCIVSFHSANKSRPTILVSMPSFHHNVRSNLRIALLSPSRCPCPCCFLSSCPYSLACHGLRCPLASGPVCSGPNIQATARSSALAACMMQLCVLIAGGDLSEMTTRVTDVQRNPS